jgi:hypothetical protein
MEYRVLDQLGSTKAAEQSRCQGFMFMADCQDCSYLLANSLDFGISHDRLL